MRTGMMTRNVRALLGACLLNWITGNGLFPLLPLVALERGMTVEQAGWLLAAGFVGLAIGSMLANQLARWIGSRKWTLAGAAALQTLAYVFMGHSTSAEHYLIGLCAAWLGAGVAVTLMQVMAGIAVDARQRGRMFGLLALAPPLGALIGASLLGALASSHGSMVAFDTGALLVLAAWCVIAFGMRGDDRHSAPRSVPRAVARHTRPSSVELGLLLAALLASTTLSFGRLAMPVLMEGFGYNQQVIAATTAVGGLVTMPFVLALGSLADRFGRRPILVVTYALVAAAICSLAFAEQLWVFYMVNVLLSIGFAVGGSVIAALAGDLVQPFLLPAALARLTTAGWVAAVLAFAGGGALLGNVAAPIACLAAALLAIVAIAPVALAGRRLVPVVTAGLPAEPIVHTEQQDSLASDGVTLSTAKSAS